MPDLGPSAITTASHVVLCLSVLLVLHEVIATMNVAARERVFGSEHARLAALALGAALIVERLYYVGARLLEPHGLDLWTAHPGPEVMSFGVAFAFFNLSSALHLALSADVSRARRVIAVQAAVLVSIWGAVAALLF